MDNKKIKISLVLNIIIVVFTIIACIIMFTGFKFMEGDLILETTKIGMFKFFTVDSNILMGIVAFIFSIQEIRLLKGKISEIPLKTYVLKLMGTVSVALTFFTVFCYLGQIVEGGVFRLLKNSNLFLHLIIPVLSMVNFCLFEKTNRLKFKYTFLGILPTILYAIFYLTNVLIHMENGKVSTIYDWYWFMQGGIWQMFIIPPFMLIVTYIISVGLWRINKKKIKKLFY